VRIKAKPMKEVPPITFEIETDEGVEVFRVPRKQRVDVVTVLSQSMHLNANGDRVYPDGQIRRALLLLIADELWVEDETQADDAVELTGQWVPVDDRDRFVMLLNSPRWEVETQDLGELVWDLIEQLTANPTTAPKP